MPDFAQPSDVMWSNPYLMPAPQPDKLSVLANILTGLGAGMSNAAASGRSEWAGIGPGAMLANQLIGNDAASAQKRQQQAAQFAMMADYRRTQEEAMREKMRMAAEAEKRKAGLGDQLNSILGFNVQGNPVQLGPPQQAGFDLMKYLTDEKGVAAPQAAAIVGNFQQESGFNPTAVHDNGTGFGLGGWRLDRRDALARYAQLRGGNIADPKLQADFMLDELKTRPEYTSFTAAKTPDEAATALMNYFRPAGWTPDNPTAGNGYGNRVGYARTYAGGPQVAQGDAVPGQGGPPQSAIASLPPEVRAAIGVMAQQDPEKAIPMLVNALQSQKKEGAWVPLDLTDPRNASMYPGLDPKKQYLRNKVTNDIKSVGEPVVTIQDKGETEAQKVQIQSANKFHLEQQDAAKSARTGLSQVDRLASLMDQLNTNKFTSTTTEVKALAKGLGIDLNALGVTDNVGVAQAADALSKQLALSLRDPSQGGGMPGALSDSDRKFLAQMIPTLETTAEGRKLMVEYARKMYRRQIEVAKIANEYIRSKDFATDPSGMFAKIQEYADKNPLFGDSDVPATGMTPAPAGAIPPPPAGYSAPGATAPVPAPPSGFKVVK